LASNAPKGSIFESLGIFFNFQPFFCKRVNAKLKEADQSFNWLYFFIGESLSYNNGTVGIRRLLLF
jgi:hypothetical protein